MEEIWKDVVGYEGYYQVSNFGRVKSLERKIPARKAKRAKSETIMNQTKNNTGYLMVNLCVNQFRKKFLVHRLVAIAFIPNPDNLPQINHKDENKENNCVDNLEWCNNVYNNNYGRHCENISKANGKPVLCVETGEIFRSQRMAAKHIGVDQTQIYRCCNGKRKTTGGYHWKFAEG